MNGETVNSCRLLEVLLAICMCNDSSSLTNSLAALSVFNGKNEIIFQEAIEGDTAGLNMCSCFFVVANGSVRVYKGASTSAFPSPSKYPGK